MTKHLLSVVALAALMVLSSCNKPTSATSNSASASASNVASTSVAPSASASVPLVSTSKAVPVESVTLDKTTATLKEGETVTLVATVLPANATNNTGVIWTTSDATIATVADGVVTAVKAGTATISANAGGKSGTCAVTVTEAINKVSDITAAGDYTVIGKVVAKDTKNIVVNDGTGVIDVYSTEAVEVGDYVKVKGTVAVFNGIFEFSNSFTITKVTDAPAVTEAPAIDLTKEIADGWGALTENTVAANKLYKWTSGAAKSGNFWMLNLPGSETKIEPSKIDTTAYTIAENKAYNVEAYFIGYETKNKYASIVVTKLEATTVAPTALTISAAGDVDSLVRGNTLQMSVAATPVYASNAVTWSSSDTASDSGIATADQVTISETGLVTAPATATAHAVTITATTTFEGSTVSATFKLNIVAKLLTITGQKLVTVGEDITLTTTTSDSATATFTYTTDEAGAAFVTIGTNGKITGKAVGTATITVAADGYTSATIDIQVLDSLATVGATAAATKFEAKGVVLAVATTTYFVVAEKIGTTTTALLCKLSNHGLTKGEYVHIVGTTTAATTSYPFLLTVTSATELTSEDHYTAPTITAADLTTKAGNSTYFSTYTGIVFDAIKVSSAEVVISGTYVNFSINGFTKGSINTTDTVTAGFYDITGFSYNVNSGGYAAVIPVSFAAATRPAATAIAITGASTIAGNDTVQLSTTSTGDFGADDPVTWTSSDTADDTVVAANKVAVDANGLVSAPKTAVVGHTVTITATSKTTATVTATKVLTVTAAITRLTLDVSDTNWPATAPTAATAYTIGGVAIMAVGLNKDTSGNAQDGGDIFVKKSTGYLYSTAATATNITEIQVTMSTNSSAGGILGVYTGTSALSTRTATTPITFSKGEVVTFTPTVANSTYFQVSNTSTSSNIRFTKIVVKILAA
jgi:uncharacterized protein YjdB